MGAWCWPLPIVLHAWTLAGPLLLLGFGLALAQRRLAPAALHLALLAGWTTADGSRLLRAPDPPSPGSLTLLSLNAGDGRAAPETLARWALEQGADALFLQELDAGQVAALERDCGEAYPFRELHGLGRRGIGVLSRHPLSRTKLVELADGSLALFGGLALAGTELAFAVVHLSGWTAVLGPWGGADESLEQVLASVGGAEPALVIGDFNATAESPLLGVFRASAFRDAFEAVGSGLGLSFPEFRRYRGLPFPPLVRIDHAFVRGLQPTSADYLHGAGSDHRAIRVQVLPESGSVYPLR